jgi:hypothetical protein
MRGRYSCIISRTHGLISAVFATASCVRSIQTISRTAGTLEMRVALEELLSRTKRVEFAGEAPHRAVYSSNSLAALLLRVN